MKTSSFCRIRHSNIGFSLVEIMVGMVVGLLGIIVIYQVFAVSEGYKRTTTSGGDAQQNGALGLYTIERDLRMAGYGINNTSVLGCTVLAYNANRVPTNFNFTMAPVVIAQGADNNAITGDGGVNTDTITVTYGNSNGMMAPAAITQTMPSPAAVFKVDNRYGFTVGDLVIAAEPGAVPPKNCTLAQIDNLPGTPGQTDNVIHNPSVSYNPAGGLGVTYDANLSKLFDVGAVPVNNVYSVQNGQLMLQPFITANPATPIVDGIVQLQAQYGRDTNADGIVDIWDANTPPANGATWAQILAVRLALVARSSQPEKPDPTTGVCNTTTVAPTWAGGTLNLSSDPNWRCYRYKVFQTTVPLRNMIWIPQ